MYIFFASHWFCVDEPFLSGSRHFLVKSHGLYTQEDLLVSNLVSHFFPICATDNLTKIHDEKKWSISTGFRPYDCRSRVVQYTTNGIFFKYVRGYRGRRIVVTSETTTIAVSFQVYSAVVQKFKRNACSIVHLKIVLRGKKL